MGNAPLHIGDFATTPPHKVLGSYCAVAHTGSSCLLSPADAIALPIDELALAVLRDLVEGREWNEWNYLTGIVQDAQFRGQTAAQLAIAEAFGWLRSHGLVARTPTQGDHAAIFVTRAGYAALEEGLTTVRARRQLDAPLHHLVATRSRRQFLLGEYEQSVFVAMKAVEVRVRALGGFDDSLVGVDLINQAFGRDGPLTDPEAVAGEREGTRALFTGAYAVLRNPAGHRDIDYDDVVEAAEAVSLASLLMRVLDRVEARLAKSPPSAG